MYIYNLIYFLKIFLLITKEILTECFEVLLYFLHNAPCKLEQQVLRLHLCCIYDILLTILEVPRKMLIDKRGWKKKGFYKYCITAFIIQ